MFKCIILNISFTATLIDCRYGVTGQSAKVHAAQRETVTSYTCAPQVVREGGRLGAEVPTCRRRQSQAWCPSSMTARTGEARRLLVLKTSSSFSTLLLHKRRRLSDHEHWYWNFAKADSQARWQAQGEPCATSMTAFWLTRCHRTQVLVLGVAAVAAGLGAFAYSRFYAHKDDDQVCECAKVLTRIERDRVYRSLTHLAADLQRQNQKVPDTDANARIVSALAEAEPKARSRSEYFPTSTK